MACVSACSLSSARTSRSMAGRSSRAAAGAGESVVDRWDLRAKKRLRDGFHHLASRRLPDDQLGKRTTAAIAGNARPGAALWPERSVEVFELGPGLRRRQPLQQLG